MRGLLCIDYCARLGSSGLNPSSFMLLRGRDDEKKHQRIVGMVDIINKYLN